MSFRLFVLQDGIGNILSRLVRDSLAGGVHLLAITATGVLQAATITVTGTGDTEQVDGFVTLREAVYSANANANFNADVVAVGAYGADTINFSIAGSGVHTITPNASFPIVTGPTSNVRVVVRALGPSLSALGVTGALQDPTVELKNANGATVISNNDWQQGEPAELQQLGLAPADNRESALVATLISANYTAIVRGDGDTTGVALVEVYHVQ